MSFEVADEMNCIIGEINSIVSTMNSVSSGINNITEKGFKSNYQTETPFQIWFELSQTTIQT